MTNKVAEELNRLEPLQRLRVIAGAIGVEIHDPNKSCPVCGGKGYLSVKENGEVQPCMCIYPGFEGVKLNREARRKMAKKTRKIKP